MEKQLTSQQDKLRKKHDELRKKMEKYDKALLELLRKGPVDLIINIIKDYI